MIYKLPVTIKLYDREYIARCELLRADVCSSDLDEALKNLRESIDEMIKEFGREAVFQDISPETEVRVLEVSV
ncbi:MAG: hypothetical protein M1609_14960 [Firmicutes bacterium]|nr:hypothetical protein [Bacillota bacterium]